MMSTSINHLADRPIKTDALSRKLGFFVPLDGEEIACLRRVQERERKFGAHRELINEFRNTGVAYVVRQGWVCSYRMFPDGRRQVIDVAIAGDILGLRCLLPNCDDYLVVAVSDASIAEIPYARMAEVFDEHPRLASAFIAAVAREEAMVVEHLVDIGRRSALARTAHYMLELCARLQRVGLAEEHSFDCPLNQYLLADVLALSAIHLNRVLRDLREAELLTFRHGRVTIHDRASLVRIADGDPEDLFQPALGSGPPPWFNSMLGWGWSPARLRVRTDRIHG